MAVKAINYSVGPDGLVPIRLAFCDAPLLGILTDRPVLSTFQRSLALQKTKSTISKHFASQQVLDAL